jgi:hypothetical protein
MTCRSSTAAPILAVLAVVLVTLGAYVGGYFWMGVRNEGIDSGGIARRCKLAARLDQNVLGLPSSRKPEQPDSTAVHQWTPLNSDE